MTGGATVALGVALIPLPGPGSLVALGGLAMLGTEFEGARKVNAKATAVAKKAAGKVAERRAAKRADKPGMSAQLVLIRGINVGGKNTISMATLRSGSKSSAAPTCDLPHQRQCHRRLDPHAAEARAA